METIRHEEQEREEKVKGQLETTDLFSGIKKRETGSPRQAWTPGPAPTSSEAGTWLCHGSAASFPEPNRRLWGLLCLPVYHLSSWRDFQCLGNQMVLKFLIRTVRLGPGLGGTAD